jgi:hypothetical protein
VHEVDLILCESSKLTQAARWETSTVNGTRAFKPMLMGPSLTIDQPETFFAVRGEELLNETGNYFVTATQEEGKPAES